MVGVSSVGRTEDFGMQKDASPAFLQQVLESLYVAGAAKSVCAIGRASYLCSDLDVQMS